MIRTFNLLRNVGKFDNVIGTQFPLSRLTVVYAENGRGKTTLAAVLRSLATGEAGFILERRRLQAANAPHIVVDLDVPPAAIFQNGIWNRTAPHLAIFDDSFVASNVCSGVEVATSHRQNLHELIVGAQGVRLNAAVQATVEQIEIHNRALRERENAIPGDRRGGLSVDAFCGLAPLADLPQLIAEAERRLAAARAAARIAAMPVFPAMTLPRIALDEVEALSRRDLLDLDEGALNRVRAHMTRLGPDGEAWVGQGMSFADRLSTEGHADCPFCAQDLRGSPILAHYRIYFGDAYNELKSDIAAAVRMFATTHAGDVPAAFERTVREAVERHAFWSDFTAPPAIDMDTAEIARVWKVAREAVQAILERKRNTPLEIIPVSEEVRRAVAAHNVNCDRIDMTAAELIAANTAIALVKEQAQEANIATLTMDIQHLRAVEARHDPQVAPLCGAYLAEKAAKTETERVRREARAALDTHREAAFPAYGLAINDFLQRFNATFRVGPVDAVNNRGGSAANYTLLIDGNPVPLTSEDGDHSFRNTLSAGDRNTLALAFFFASLQMDPDRASKVVVIDDPMTSLDEHRTLHTLQEMDHLARDVTAMIVMSHSKPFLLGVWDKCRQLPKAAIQIMRAGTGSTFAGWDVNAAMITEHDRRYAAAVAYLNQADPAMERRVAESLRPMLESYARVAYPSDFSPGEMLGRFYDTCVRRLGGPQEIMRTAAAQELRAILDYANRYHHDTNTAYATELINDAELSDFTRRTLAFIKRP